MITEAETNSPPSNFAPTIAIVGSGPSGCYTAQFLRKQFPDGEIVVFERLPVPYGLVRFGVAPDHQATKSVVTQFDRLFERDRIILAANVNVGVDIEFEVLRELFDVVVLATGLPNDNQIPVVGTDLVGVIGSGKLIRYINGHPDECSFKPAVGNCPVIVGMGNVAIDILRILLKTSADLEGSDIDDEVHRAVSNCVQTVDIVSRSSAEQSKCDTAAIKELAKISCVHFNLREPSLSCAQLDHPKLKALRELSLANRDVPARIVVNFWFGFVPLAINGDDRVEAITFRSIETGKELVLRASSVLSAIGFTEGQQSDLGQVGNVPDTLTTGTRSSVFRVGWLVRGPTGAIPVNRLDAKRLAEEIALSISSKQIRLGKIGWEGLSDAVVKKSVNFRQWKLIDAYECRDVGRCGKVRVKLRTYQDLINIARRDGIEDI